jgi:hypothetical protein
LTHYFLKYQQDQTYYKLYEGRSLSHDLKLGHLPQPTIQRASNIAATNELPEDHNHATAIANCYFGDRKITKKPSLAPLSRRNSAYFNRLPDIRGIKYKSLVLYPYLKIPGGGSGKLNRWDKWIFRATAA